MSEVAIVESKGLIVIPSEKALTAFATPDAKGIEPYLAEMRRIVDAEAANADPTTAAGRAAIVKFAYKITQSKTALKALGTSLAQDARKVPDLIYATNRHIEAKLDAWAEDYRKPVTDRENAEKARLQRHKDALEALQAMAVTAGLSSETLKAKLVEAQAVVISAACEEFATDYVQLQKEAVEALTAAIAKAEAAEAEKLELETLRREANERKAKDAAEKAIKDAAEKAALDQAAAEKAKADAVEAAIIAERAAAAKREADLAAQVQAEKAKAAAAAAEAVRVAEAASKAAADAAEAKAKQIAAEAAEAQRLAAVQAADKDHRRKINSQIVADFIAQGYTDDEAIKLMKLLVTNKISHTTVNY
jgi:colicin import membrane protein